MRRSPAAEHLAAPPLARQQLRTARNALNVCSTVPASDYAGIATIAPPPEPREATCECVETKKRRLNGRTLAEACVRLSSLSHSSVRQSVSSLGGVTSMVTFFPSVLCRSANANGGCTSPRVPQL